MIRWGSLFVFCSLLVLAPAGGAASTPPSLQLVKLAPLAVRGAGFQPAERVRVTLLARSTRVQKLTASSTGTFVARFDTNVGLSRCSAGFSVRAIGGMGTNALLKIPRPACMPERSP